jgi:hypothetical protein
VSKHVCTKCSSVPAQEGLELIKGNESAELFPSFCFLYSIQLPEIMQLLLDDDVGNHSSNTSISQSHTHSLTHSVTHSVSQSVSQSVT